MILTKLYELSQSLPPGDETPSMYGKVKIRWLIPLNADGTLRGEFFDLQGSTKAEQRGKELIVPDLVRSSGIKPKLLADNGEYALGLQKEGADTKKVAERHQQFKALVAKCADVTQEPSIQAVSRFLANWNLTQLTQAGVDPAENFTFQVYGIQTDPIIPAEAREKLIAVQRFWATETAGEDNPIMRCLVTGEIGPVESRLPVKIKGIPNGQTAGTSLVSANAAPFTSYGLENSLTSPMSRDAGEGFGKALNYLIRSPDHHWRCDPVMYVFWTREPVGYTYGQSYKRDQPKTIKALLQSAKRGDPQMIGSKQNRFYGLSLTASGGRAVVRSWLEVTIPEAATALDRWFDAQEIVDSFGKTTDSYLNTYRLASAMYRDAATEMEATALCEFNDVAMKGGKLGLHWLAKVVKRWAIEPNPTFESTVFERAALIKLILTTQMQTKEANPMGDLQELNLDPQFEGCEAAERPILKAAYQCGRLLAQLDNLQKAALGDVNTTLIDRYYGAAAATPGKVFGELLKDAQAHLRKLRVTKPGTYEALQQKLEEVLGKLPADEWPNTLTMQQQSLFSLGYYHQRAYNRKQAIDRKAENAAKDAAKAAETDP